MQKWTVCAEYVDLLDEHNPEKKETQIYSWKSKNEVISLKNRVICTKSPEDEPF